MRHRIQSELGLLIEQLLLDLERLRPGLPERASLAELRLLLGLRATSRLTELHRQFTFDPHSDAELATQLALYRRELTQLFLPRYAQLAHRQNQLERRLSAPTFRDQLLRALRWFTFGIVACICMFPLRAPWLPWTLAAAGPVLWPLLARRIAIANYRHALKKLHHDLDLAGAALLP